MNPALLHALALVAAFGAAILIVVLGFLVVSVIAAILFAPRDSVQATGEQNPVFIAIAEQPAATEWVASAHVEPRVTCTVHGPIGPVCVPWNPLGRSDLNLSIYE